ncbi:MAG: hypothetical protein GW808_07955 [Sphingomonadales bacterium]|nr:hypothetical protein [Sphingomonadales bacterium]PIX67534.1 MAG: hypothetical protein COZ43_00880 [Sphingomonadales bacterium CG_4_10_14_3_um_filter_58_15]NCO48817.1 hypothetical protein [Sphingomonadales bacterium]NCP00715.1 hypothetical protein [Sphingomonadales bacterium]NCP25882.1 hypothetical protein [Sphingomonadales bacterium]
MRISFGLVVLSFAVSACSGTEEDANSPNVREEASRAALVSADYRKSFDRAWEMAGEGRSPTTACAGVVGKAVGLLQTTATDGQPRADALAALDACYVQVMARFVDAKLAEGNQGSSGCISLLSTLPVHRSSLGSFLDDVGENKADYDRRLNELIGDKVGSACPDSVSVLLGT